MFPKLGPVELLLILVIVTMLFGVGKLPEVFGSVGRGIREFRRNATDPQEAEKPEVVESVEAAPVASTAAPVSEPAEKQAVN